MILQFLLFVGKAFQPNILSETEIFRAKHFKSLAMWICKMAVLC